MAPLEIIAKFYDRRSKTFEILVDHGRRVGQKALAAAAKVAHLNPDLDFIKNAALLHDIGIMHTASPGFGCHGKHPYICHGFLGREMLDSIGLPQYGLISERHVGVGISSGDIRSFTLPLPERVAQEETQLTQLQDRVAKLGNALRMRYIQRESGQPLPSVDGAA